MKIIMKDYGLDSFSLKDIYTWDEIIDIIRDLEHQVEALQEQVKRANHEYDEWDYYDDNEDELKNIGN